MPPGLTTRCTSTARAWAAASSSTKAVSSASVQAGTWRGVAATAADVRRRWGACCTGSVLLLNGSARRASGGGLGQQVAGDRLLGAQHGAERGVHFFRRHRLDALGPALHLLQGAAGGERRADHPWRGAEVVAREDRAGD